MGPEGITGALAPVYQAEHPSHLAAGLPDGQGGLDRRPARRGRILDESDGLSLREASLDAAAETVLLGLLADEEAEQVCGGSRRAAALRTAETNGTAPTAMPPTASTAGPASSCSRASSPASSTPRGRIRVWRRSR